MVRHKNLGSFLPLSHSLLLPVIEVYQESAASAASRTRRRLRCPRGHQIRQESSFTSIIHPSPPPSISSTTFYPPLFRLVHCTLARSDYIRFALTWTHNLVLPSIRKREGREKLLGSWDRSRNYSIWGAALFPVSRAKM